MQSVILGWIQDRVKLVMEDILSLGYFEYDRYI